DTSTHSRGIGLMQKICGAPNKEGKPCRARMGLNPITGYCLWHDDTRKEEQRALVKKGVAARSRAKRIPPPHDMPGIPKTAEDAEVFAAWLTHAVVANVIDARTAREAATCLREFRQAHEKRKIDE